MKLLSSRRLPGQEYSWQACNSACESGRGGRAYCSDMRDMKCFKRIGISSLRSRKGGNCKVKKWYSNVCYRRRLRTDLPHGGAGGYEEYVITKLFHVANIVLLIDAKPLIDSRVEFGFLERLGQIVMCSQPYSLYYLAGIADAGEHDYLYPRDR